MSSKFKVKLYEEYALGSHVFSELPDPSDDDAHIDEDLVEYLGYAHDENPVIRNTKPLARYLGTCAPLNSVTFNGLLRGVLEGPLLSHGSAQKLQVAMLGMIHRRKLLLLILLSIIINHY